jgi:hypothetical protein
MTASHNYFLFLCVHTYIHACMHRYVQQNKTFSARYTLLQLQRIGVIVDFLGQAPNPWVGFAEFWAVYGSLRPKQNYSSSDEGECH